MKNLTEEIDGQTKSGDELEGYAPLVQWMASHPRITGTAHLCLGLLAAKVFLVDVICRTQNSHVIAEIHHYRLGIICGLALIGFGLSILIMGSKPILVLRHRKGDPWIQKGQVVAIVLITGLLWVSYQVTVLALRSSGFR